MRLHFGLILNSVFYHFLCFCRCFPNPRQNLIIVLVSTSPIDVIFFKTKRELDYNFLLSLFFLKNSRNNVMTKTVYDWGRNLTFSEMIVDTFSSSRIFKMQRASVTVTYVAMETDFECIKLNILNFEVYLKRKGVIIKRYDI